MDISICMKYISAWIWTILFTIGSFFLYSVYKTRVLRHFPGPRPIPYIGILPTMIKKGFHGLDTELVKKYGPIVGTYIGHFPSIIVADPDMIKEIYVKEFRSFTNRADLFYTGELLGGSVTFSRGDHWKFLRSVLSGAFSPAKLKQTFSVIEKCTERMLSKIEKESRGGKSVNVERICHAHALDVICGSAFGIDVDSQNDANSELMEMAAQMTNVTFANPVLIIQAMFPEIKTLMTKFKLDFFPTKAMDYFVDIAKSAVKERKDAKTTRNDFLQLLINEHREDHKQDNNNKIEDNFESYKERDSRERRTHIITVAEIKTKLSKQEAQSITERDINSNSLLFIIEGLDSTALAVVFSQYSAVVNPECQDKLIKEIDTEITEEKPDYEQVSKLVYLDMFLSEVLRMYPINPRSNREADEDIVINGYRIPKGAEIAVPIYVLHHNPEFWPNPDKFDPTRFLPENKEQRHPYSYMPFGHGPRNCTGARYAQLIIKMSIVRILQKFRLRKTPEIEDPIQFDETSGGILRPKHPVMIRFEPRGH